MKSNYIQFMNTVTALDAAVHNLYITPLTGGWWFESALQSAVCIKHENSAKFPGLNLCHAFIE